MAGMGAVEADADVGEFELFQALGFGLIDQRAVGREGRRAGLLERAGGEVEEVGADEGFTAGEEDGGTLNSARCRARLCRCRWGARRDSAWLPESWCNSNALQVAGA